MKADLMTLDGKKSDQIDLPIIFNTEWNLLQHLQSTALASALGLNIVYGYFPLFTCSETTSSSIALNFSYLQIDSNLATPASFQIEYSPYPAAPPAVWTVVANVPINQTYYLNME